MKTVLACVTAALALAGSALAAAPALVEPAQAAPGATVTITGAPGPVTLEPLEPGVDPVSATIPARGTVRVAVPAVPAGTQYRVVVPGADEAPVLTVTEKLDGTTSTLLFGFGFLLVLALAVGGVVFHRRWRDAIS